MTLLDAPLDAPLDATLDANAVVSDRRTQRARPIVYATTNGGRSWTHSKAPFGEIDFASATYGRDMTGRHLYYTTNAGRSWRRFSER